VNYDSNKAIAFIQRQTFTRRRESRVPIISVVTDRCPLSRRVKRRD